MNLHGTADQPKHRQHVCCWIELWKRTPWDKYQECFRDDQSFSYWKVLAIAPHGQALTQPSITPARARIDEKNHHTSLGQPLKFVSNGYVCVTGFNFDRKHDERVFFVEGTAPKPVELTAPLKLAWENLIRDYRTNQDLVNERDRPGALNRAGWSRHMKGDEDCDLTEGSLVFARLEEPSRIMELYPVMIARKLYLKNPLELLPESLQPATHRNKLSPADRVFGWVSQDGDTCENPAYRSQLRVGVVECLSDNAVEQLANPLVLPILGQPKPAQGRFYLGNQYGRRQLTGGSKEKRGYVVNNRIRGPKIFPHHSRFLLQTPRKQAHTASAQNRSIREYIKNDTEFLIDLHVLNLSRTELAALVWLLSLPANHFLRLGLGKPIGFGSVRIEIDGQGSCIADGKDWVTKFTEWSAKPNGMDLLGLRAQYESMMNSLNPSLLQSFLQLAKGFGDVDVKYPPSPDNPNEIGQHFKWFAANERRAAGALSLPDVSDVDPLLPNAP